MKETSTISRTAQLIAMVAVFIPFLCGISVFAAIIHDQVELRATQKAGVPLHKEPRGTNDFQRVPDGTLATVIDTAKGGQWLKLSLPDGRRGWVTSRYVSTSAPSTATSPAPTKPLRTEEGTVTRVADGDTLTVITPNQTKLRIRMLGVDAPETPKGTKFPGQSYGKEAEAYLKQLVAGKRVKVEIYQVDRYRRLLSTIFLDGKNINLTRCQYRSKFPQNHRLKRPHLHSERAVETQDGYEGTSVA